MTKPATHVHTPYSHHGSTFRCRCGTTSGSGAGPWQTSETRACAVCAAPTAESGEASLCSWHRALLGRAAVQVTTHPG